MYNKVYEYSQAKFQYLKCPQLKTSAFSFLTCFLTSMRNILSRISSNTVILIGLILWQSKTAMEKILILFTFTLSSGWIRLKIVDFKLIYSMIQLKLTSITMILVGTGLLYPIFPRNMFPVTASPELILEIPKALTLPLLPLLLLKSWFSSAAKQYVDRQRNPISVLSTLWLDLLETFRKILSQILNQK